MSNMPFGSTCVALPINLNDSTGSPGGLPWWLLIEIIIFFYSIVIIMIIISLLLFIFLSKAIIEMTD